MHLANTFCKVICKDWETLFIRVTLFILYVFNMYSLSLFLLMYSLYLFLRSQLNNDKNKNYNCDGHEITASKGLMKIKSTLLTIYWVLLHNSQRLLWKRFAQYLYKRSWGRLQVFYQETVGKTITYYGRFTMTLANYFILKTTLTITTSICRTL